MCEGGGGGGLEWREGQPPWFPACRVTWFDFHGPPLRSFWISLPLTRLSRFFAFQLLSHATDPTRIQPHLIRCFEGVHRLVFHDASSSPLDRRRVSSRQLWSRLSGRSGDGTVDATKQWQDSLASASMASAHAADLIVKRKDAGISRVSGVVGCTIGATKDKT